MNHRGTYISRKRRDEHAKALKAQGLKVRRSTERGQQLHPEHINDAAEEGITFETGFGNADYQRIWGVLYIVEAT